MGWWKRRFRSDDSEPASGDEGRGEKASRDERAAQNRGPYADAREHLADELRLLDLCIHHEVLADRRRLPENPLEQLRGLVLSDEEIDALVSMPEDPDPKKTQKKMTAALHRLEKRIEERRKASAESSVFLTLPHLGRLFQLSRFEEQVLLICLAPELHRKYDKLYAYLQDDVTRKRPSVDLALRLLGLTGQERWTARSFFDPEAPLVKYRLLHLFDAAPDGPQPLLGRALKLDDRIVDLLLGYQRIDARLEGAARWAEIDTEGLRSLPSEVAERMHELVRTSFLEASASPGRVLFHVRGPYGAGKKALAGAAARELDLPLLIGDLRRVRDADQLWLLARESFLQPAVLCLEGFDAVLAEDRLADLEGLLAAVESMSQLTFLLGGRPWQPRGRLHGTAFISLELEGPDDGRRARLWQARLEAAGLAEEVDAGFLAGMFRFTPGQMRDAAALAGDLARWHGRDGVTRQDLYAACRAQASPELAHLARKIEPRQGWDDIVLTADPLAQLWEICHQARYRHVVLGDWGFDRKLSYGKGLAALFSGPPGTGKTLAAEVVAGELGLDLYKIDLSQVISKYIGETEKNLDRIFSAAELANAILFFDEADALFGKRSEVRDSHDRYANVEISYLLQKMEEYEGISILATNLRKHMDDAFLRRLQTIVEFPFPDAAERERIWQVTFPAEAPVGDDVDFAALGHGLRLAGGNIKNVGLLAAYYAAADGGVVHMPHLLAAARREHQKMGRTWNERDWAPNGGTVS